MRVKSAAISALVLVLGVLAPAAQANHQFGDALLDSGGASRATTVRTITVAPPLERGGFDWADAAVGAGITAGVALALLGLALLSRRGRAGVRTAPAA